jgi:hypothetical protein
MVSTYTTNAGVEKMATGDQSGSWGTTTNTNFDIIDRSLSGVGVIDLSASGATHTLTTSNGSLSDGHYHTLILYGATEACVITVSPNDAQRAYWVENTTSYTCTLTQGSGGNVSIAAGRTKLVFCYGTGSGSKVTDVFLSTQISGGSIDGTPIGATSPSTGSFTDLTANADVDFSSVDNKSTVRSDLGLAIGTDVQAYDAGLQSISGLTTAADKMIYTSGSDTYAVTSLSSFARTILDDANAAAVQATLGVVPGTDVQVQDAELSAIAGLTSAADKLPYFTGSGTADVATFTAAGRALVDDADAAAQRATLGLGSISTQAASSVSITGGAISGITDLAVADGGTGASTASGARTNLGLVIGTDVQTQDATLESLSALGTAADKMAYTTGIDTWAEASITTAGRAILDDASATAQRVTLGVEIGVNVQAYDADLDSWAGKTAPTGAAVGTTDTQTLTSKTIDPASNTIDGDHLDITFTPSNYTPDASPAEADDVDDLAAHLKGIDAQLAIAVYDGTNVTITGGTIEADVGRVDTADATKKLVYDLSGLTTATTRTLTIPDASGTVLLDGNIGSTVQAHGDVLDDLSALGANASDGEILVGTGAGALTWESGATARASLGLTIGTHVQAYDAELAAIAGLTSAADKVPYFTGSGTASVATFTAAGRALVDDADASAQRTTLGLVIGTDVQAYSANLTTYASNALTSAELNQLQNIDTTTVSATQWGYLGAMDQGVATTDNPQFGGYNLAASQMTIPANLIGGVGPFQIRSNVNTSYTAVSGSTAINLGANILMYGEGAGSPAYDFVFRNNATTVLKFDYGTTTWDFQANAITTTGNITAAGLNLGNETMSNYDEGTFTPAISDAASAGNMAGGTYVGRYTRIGNMVFIYMNLVNIDTTGMTAGNAIFIQGLPFTVKSGTAGHVGTCLTHQMDQTTGYNSFQVRAMSGTTYSKISECGDNNCG